MEEKELLLLKEKFSKGKPLNILVRVIVAISVLATVLSSFLPFGKIMFWVSESFSISDLPDYDTSNLLILLSLLIGVISNFIPLISIEWLNKNQIKKIITASIITSILSFIALVVFKVSASQAIMDVESYCHLRVDEGIAYFTSYISIFLPLMLNLMMAICVSLISSGKVSVEKMFGAKKTAPSVENADKTSASANDAPELLARYKALLDSGAITEEEYEAKKKEILGL